MKAGVIGLVILGWAAEGTAADWPMWGGTPARNMVAAECGLPTDFGPIQFKGGGNEVDVGATKHLKWVAKLGSQSYGNVVVAAGRVFVGTNNDPPRDPRHSGDRSILLCLDEHTGALLWQLVVPKLAAGQVNDWEQLGILSSPAVEGDRVYLVTSRAEVLCLDARGLANGNDGPFTNEAHYVVQDIVLDRGRPTERPAPPIEPGPRDADILWCYDMIHELGVFPHNAANSAPLLYGDLVYVATGNGRDWTHANVPFPFAPSLIALDRRTGTLAATDDAGIGPRVFHGQWSSPAAGLVDGRPLLFYGGGDGWCYAFDARPALSGGRAWLRTVWRFDCNPPHRKVREGRPLHYGDPAGPSEINATPVFVSNRVFVAVGQDPEQGEGAGCLSCMDATRTGDITQTGKVWAFDAIGRSLSTVAIDAATGLLFTADLAGVVYCLDAHSGTVFWTHDMKAQVWGSPLLADGKVYLGDADGDWVVLAATKQKTVLGETNLGAPIYSSPVAANGVLFVQTCTHLFAFALEQKSGGS